LEKLGVRADAGQTQVIVDGLPDQQKIWPDMTFHIADPDAAKRVRTTPLWKRIGMLQIAVIHPKAGEEL